MSFSREQVVGLVVLAVVIAGGIGFLVWPDGDGGRAGAGAAVGSSTTSLAPRLSVPAPPAGSLAPLTGLPVADPAVLARPALVVKVDNLDLPGDTARPQAGLNQADVVIEELVEFGVTRFLAVFHSTDPARVGPVRSARTSDIALLAPFGRPLFAYSGANPGVAQAVAAAPVVDVSGAGGYGRDGGRSAPHDLFADPAALRAATMPDQAPPAPLFAYRPNPAAPPAGGEPAPVLSLGFVGPGAAPVSYVWDPGLGGFARAQVGTPHVDDAGAPIAPPNVVVLHTEYGTSPADARSPEALPVGEGEAWVLTAGSLVRGRWSRPSAEQPARLVDAADTEIGLTPGRTWVELAPPGAATLG